MALTRKLLRGMNLTDEQVETIIEAHTETVDGLKNDIEKYKTDAEKLPGVQRELDDYKKTIGDTGEVVLKADFDRLQSEYDTYKADIKARETHTAKEAAFRNLLKEAGIDPKRIDAIVKITDIDGIELAEDGKIKDADTRTETVKKEFSEFVVTYGEHGANVPTPPANTSGGPVKSKDEIYAMKDGRYVLSASERQAELSKLYQSQKGE